jgi:hypothetical protein
MTRSFFSVCAALCCGGVVALAGMAHAADVQVGQIALVDRPLIAGLWAMPIPQKNCVEYYNFREDGEFLVKSSGEWTSGSYEYDLPETDEERLPLLTMSVKYDNLATDCSGNAIDQSQDVQRQFVRWDKEQRKIEFCGTAEGQQCVLALSRVLP